VKITFFTENAYCGGLDSFLVSLIDHWPYPEDELVFICNALHPGIEIIESRLSRPCSIVRHRLHTFPDLMFRIKQSLLRRFISRLFSPLLRYAYFLYYLGALRAILFRGEPDRLVVVNGGHPGGDTCQAAVIAWGIFASNKPRAVYNFHNLATTPRWFEKWPSKLIDRLIVGYSKAIISVSRVCAESLRKRIGDEGMAKVSWIYNGVSSSQTSMAPPAATLREELDIPLDSPICMMLGTYEPRKGHDFLLQAFRKVVAKIPTAYLVICGYGYPDEIERVTRLVELYGLSYHVRLQGFRRDVEAMLKQSDLLLVASQAYESFGLTSVEAMANRIPVVATRVGGISEVVVDGEGGFCVDPDDIAGYADRVVSFLKNPDFRKEQAEKGYQRYRRLFSAERMAQEYAQTIRKD